MYAVDQNTASEEDWEGNPFRTLLPAELGKGLEIYQLTVTRPNPHHHDTYDQIYIIGSGQGVMEVGPERQEVGPGWVIHIPRGLRHSLTPLAGTSVVLYSIIHHLP